MFKLSSKCRGVSHGQVTGGECYRQRAEPISGPWSGNEFVFEEKRGPVCQEGGLQWGKHGMRARHGLGRGSELEKGLGSESSARRHRSYIYQHRSSCREIGGSALPGVEASHSPGSQRLGPSEWGQREVSRFAQGMLPRDHLQDVKTSLLQRNVRFKWQESGRPPRRHRRGSQPGSWLGLGGSECSLLWCLAGSFWPRTGGQWLPASDFLAEGCGNAPQ